MRTRSQAGARPLANWRAAACALTASKSISIARRHACRLRELLATVKPQLPSDATLSTALPRIGSRTYRCRKPTKRCRYAVNDRNTDYSTRNRRGNGSTFAKQSTKPFRVALPAYSSALVLDADGHTIGVERAALPRRHASNCSAIRAVAGLLRDLKNAEPRGIVWFRLPLPGDRRA